MCLSVCMSVCLSAVEDPRRCPTPSRSNSLHFNSVFRKIWLRNRLVPPPHWGWRLPSGKSWIRSSVCSVYVPICVFCLCLHTTSCVIWDYSPTETKEIKSMTEPVVDPGFSRGFANSRGGDTNLIFCKTFAESWIKLKNLDREGEGVSGAPWIRHWERFVWHVFICPHFVKDLPNPFAVQYVEHYR